jgi:hypothetical protein
MNKCKTFHSNRQYPELLMQKKLFTVDKRLFCTLVTLFYKLKLSYKNHRMLKSFSFFILIVLCFSFTASSQLKKGTRMVGVTIGSIFYNNGNADISFPAPTQGYSYKTTSFGAAIAPSMGWFISDNTVIGAMLNINPVWLKNTYEFSGTTYRKDESNTFNLGIGGGVRNYFNNSSTYKPFGQLNINFGISSQNTEGFFYGGSGPGVYKETYDGKSSGGFFTNAALALGFTKMLNAHTGLDLYAGYNYSYSKNTLKTTTLTDAGINGSIDQTAVSEPTTKFTSHGFVLGLGFQIFLEARK